jgi:hypothetical protein
MINTSLPPATGGQIDQIPSLRQTQIVCLRGRDGGGKNILVVRKPNETRRSAEVNGVAI